MKATYPLLESAAQLVAQIPDGATIAVSGAGGGIYDPEELLLALADRFERTGSPRGLTIVHSMGLGDRNSRGFNPIAKPGLIKRHIGGHFGNSPELGRLIRENQIEAYNLPLGVLSQLYRESAGNRPGLLTTVGLGTFADPVNGGGKLNARTTEDLVSRVEIDGELYLLYRAPRIDFALLKASAVDLDGNLSVDDEPSYLDVLETATAAHARHPETGKRGRVLVQVKKLHEGGMHARRVHIPSVLVDGVAHEPHAWQTYDAEYDAGFAGEHIEGLDQAAVLPFGYRKVIARRAADAIADGDVVNVGVGVPDGIASVLAESGRLDKVTMTNEHGIFGGITAVGLTFGASRNYDSVVPMPTIIDLYQGGLLDVACLGFAQIDAAGNVNVSRYGSEITGAGGFIDITQSASRVIFCGSLTAGGLAIDYAGGQTKVTNEGRATKFVGTVDEVTFSAEEARRRGQEVLYVTERVVFRLGEDGLELIELAPGVGIEDVLPLMEFTPRVGAVKQMDQKHFRKEVTWQVTY